MQRRYSVVDVDGAGVSSLQRPVARNMVVANNFLEVTNNISFSLWQLTLVNADRSSSNQYSGLKFQGLEIFPTYETAFDVMFSCLPFLPFSFLTAVNIFEIIAALEIIELPGGQILFKARGDVCNAQDDWCTVLAGGQYNSDNQLVDRSTRHALLHVK